MKIYVGVTDNDWFYFLSKIAPDEINFWQPGSQSVFKVLKPGELFLFKLHAPINSIAGGGVFIKYMRLPLSIAWRSFKEKNGVPDFETFFQKISKYRHAKAFVEHDPEIGCIMLSNPFFFKPEEYIQVPPDWSPSIVSGKSYLAYEPVGKWLQEQLEQRLAFINAQLPNTQEKDALSLSENERYGIPYLINPRIGQGIFRSLVIDAYKRCCAITGEQTLPVLDAAHIKPYDKSGPHNVKNGLLLRTDIHRLFDQGLVTLTPDFHVEVSNRIKEEYDNGKEYYKYHGQRMLIIPDEEYERPSPEFIQWHNENVFNKVSM
ncbi:MAG: restriction endonuclease [Candidatus Fischerbacteria bacterium RBG_13_37_8]|uniref:Restriction endonuclease n=1 Tax=Candidatus Fischerbacteria bacterium RBG_13_37_8 TaxID=1817863 RepID=A0A1F5VJN7_9BACT|nr:MAG: restriction endonuclease [Candidatus Fischerbacteria bacterium RBG_13_37_8]